jgi:hypothetical protein
MGKRYVATCVSRNYLKIVKVNEKMAKKVSDKTKNRENNNDKLVELRIRWMTYGEHLIKTGLKDSAESRESFITACGEFCAACVCQYVKYAFNYYDEKEHAMVDYGE